MRNARSIAALAACAALLAGCGGGGGSTPAAPHVSSTVAPASAPTGAPVATAQLTIKYPATFHVANKGKASSARSSAATRTPAYVNATSGYYLDIFVNGTDETSGLQTSPTTPGTQSINLPLYSSNAQQIVAIETATGVYAYPPVVLAIGETDLPSGSFNAGDVTSISLTMLMNAVVSGITSDATYGTDAVTATQTSLSTPYLDTAVAGCGTPYGQVLYLFTADPENGFVSNAGLGVVIPTLTTVAQQPGTYPVDSVNANDNGLNAGFYISYPSTTGGLILNTLFSNPAAAIAIDAVDNGGVYPGVDALYQQGTLINPISRIQTTPVTNQIYVSPSFEGC